MIHLAVCWMLQKHVHGNVGAVRQAVVGQAAALWSKMQQTWEHCGLGCGLSYTAKKVNVFLDYLHATLQIPRMCGPNAYNKQGTPLSCDHHVQPIHVLTTLLYACN